MKESYIRKKVLDELTRQGYVCWWPYPPRNTYAKEKDILSIFDVLAVKRKTSEVRWIQFTSLSNVSARKKKILDYFRANEIFLPLSEVWGYIGAGDFRKVEITYQEVFPSL